MHHSALILYCYISLLRVKYYAITVNLCKQIDKMSLCIQLIIWHNVTNVCIYRQNLPLFVDITQPHNRIEESW